MKTSEKRSRQKTAGILPDAPNAERILWDLPYEKREEWARALNKDPADVFRRNESLFIKALNSFSWHELIGILGREELLEMLDDKKINKLFPRQRREYYRNARRLLSKYPLSSSG